MSGADVAQSVEEGGEGEAAVHFLGGCVVVGYVEVEVVVVERKEKRRGFLLLVVVVVVVVIALFPHCC